MVAALRDALSFALGLETREGNPAADDGVVG
jgi:hypothetical protein